jgi:hypothetical protein
MKKIILIGILLGLLINANVWAKDCTQAFGGAGDQQKLIQDIRMCTMDARSYDPQLNVYCDPSTCKLTFYGSPSTSDAIARKVVTTFGACMKQSGWTMGN